MSSLSLKARIAENQLFLIDGLLQSGQKGIAVRLLRGLIKAYPDTPASDEAKRLLESFDPIPPK